MNTTPASSWLFSSMTRKKIGMLIASLLVFTATLTVLFYEGSKKTVALTIDGEKKVVKTHAETVGEVLDDLNIPIKDADYLSHSADTNVKNELNVVWKPAKIVKVVENDEKKSYWTTADTVSEFLKQEKIEIGEHDNISFTLEDPIENNSMLTIDRAFPLVLKDGKKKENVWSTSTTVADFLEQQGVTLGKLDRVEPNLKEIIKPKDVIKVIRVEKVTDVVEEPIDYAIVTKNDANLTKGSEKVVQEGQEGILKKEFEITKENGKEVKRKLIAETTIKDSQDKIVAIGTKVNAAPSAPADQKATAKNVSSTPSGGKEMVMNATAYTAHCNGCSGVTATGINLRANPGMKVIAVDPNVIPLGSKVWVEGYGNAIAGDTGGAIKGNRIDVFVPSKQQAYSFGRKQVRIKVLN